MKGAGRVRWGLLAAFLGGLVRLAGTLFGRPALEAAGLALGLAGLCLAALGGLDNRWKAAAWSAAAELIFTLAALAEVPGMGALAGLCAFGAAYLITLALSDLLEQAGRGKLADRVVWAWDCFLGGKLLLLACVPLSRWIPAVVPDAVSLISGLPYLIMLAATGARCKMHPNKSRDQAPPKKGLPGLCFCFKVNL